MCTGKWLECMKLDKVDVVKVFSSFFQGSDWLDSVDHV